MSRRPSMQIPPPPPDSNRLAENWPGTKLAPIRRIAVPRPWPGRIRRWLAIAGICGLLAWVLSVVVRMGESNTVPPPAAARSVDRIRFAQEARQLVRDFYECRELSRMLKMVRAEDRVAPLMRQWYLTHSFSSAKELAFSDRFRLIERDGNAFVLSSVTLLPAGVERLTAVEFTPQGPRIDWELAVNYQPGAWSTLKGQRPAGPVELRVRVAIDHYYNFRFSDSQVWQCFRLTHPEEDTLFYGYVRRLTPLCSTLVQGAGLYEPEYQVILSVAFPADIPDESQIQIESLVSDSWLK